MKSLKLELGNFYFFWVPEQCACPRASQVGMNGCGRHVCRLGGWFLSPFLLELHLGISIFASIALQLLVSVHYLSSIGAQLPRFSMRPCCVSCWCRAVQLLSFVFCNCAQVAGRSRKRVVFFRMLHSSGATSVSGTGLFCSPRSSNNSRKSFLSLSSF
jgi:hypothetical protein